MRFEEGEIVAVVLALSFFAFLSLRDITVRAIFVIVFLISVLGGWWVAHFIDFVIVEDETRLGHYISGELPYLIHTECLLEFEVKRILLVVSHEASRSHQADIDRSEPLDYLLVAAFYRRQVAHFVQEHKKGVSGKFVIGVVEHVCSQLVQQLV